MKKCEQCSYKNTCVARIIDERISGCNMEEYVNSQITIDQLQIEKTYTNYITL